LGDHGAMDNPDFIEITPNALPPDACAALIARFEASGQDQPGRVASGVRPELKLSRDVWISGKPEWRDAEEQLNAAMFRGLLAYVRKYPYILLAPLMFQWPDAATGELRAMRPEDIAGMDDNTLGDVIRTSLRPGGVNLQRYTADQGGFPYWHCEQTPTDPHAEMLHRVLLWSIYLNEGFGEGETEFFHQQRRIVPRTGALLIAPTAFTHTHRGNRPQRRDKYIATSWVLYQRAEVLFGARK
jgi:hypothetical protein